MSFRVPYQTLFSWLHEHDVRYVVLRDIEGLSYEAIGEALGLQAGTVKSRLHRGRVQLKTALERWQAGVDPTRPSEEDLP